MKTVAACSRGPSLVLLTTAPPLTITSAVIVMAGCMTYLFQGPPQKLEAGNSTSFSASFAIKKGFKKAEGAFKASVGETNVQA